MKIYKVYEDDTYHYGYCVGETDVKYYINVSLAEDDLKKRLSEWSSCPCRIEEIFTED